MDYLRFQPYDGYHGDHCKNGDNVRGQRPTSMLSRAYLKGNSFHAGAYLTVDDRNCTPATGNLPGQLKPPIIPREPMELINTILTGPVLPATIFLGILLVWSLLAILGTVDFDIPGTGMNLDGDVSGGGGGDLDPSAAAGTAGLGLAASRWLNLNSIPVVIWTALFGVVWWFTSAMLWVLIDQKFFSPPGWLWSSLLLVRNVAIAAPLTKLITNPMRGWFIHEKITATSLIGRECVITSSEATPDFGQVKLKTDGAPLLLNVRTDGEHLAQGARVWITHYDEKRRVYMVSPTGTDPHI